MIVYNGSKCAECGAVYALKQSVCSYCHGDKFERGDFEV